MPSTARYAPIPNPHTDPAAQDEMEAAFLESDDEDDRDDDRHHVSAARTTRNGYSSLPSAEPESPESPLREPGVAPQAYDFERADYGDDWARPPPGSPPASTQLFQAQPQGNSNGVVPDFSAVARDAQRRTGGWVRKVLPQRVAERLGVGSAHVEGAIGGGTSNDGVFANVTAKPTRPVRVTEGELPIDSWSLSTAKPMTMPQATTRISFQKKRRKMHRPRTLLPRPMPSRRTGRRPFTLPLLAPALATS